MTLNPDHQARVARMLRGERQVTDLDRLFADLRSANPGRQTIREIGDFAAHRQERSRGIVMDRAVDMFTSARCWVRQMQGIAPSVDDLRAVGLANLKTVPENRIRERLKISKQTAQSQLIQGINKLSAGKPLKARQREIINYLGTSFIWQCAFDCEKLNDDFIAVLKESGALAEADEHTFRQCSSFVTLHALTLMHGSRLSISEFGTAPLFMDIREETGLLRIRTEIQVDDTVKPTSLRVTVFDTQLLAENYCVDLFLSTPPQHSKTIEIGPDGRLRFLE